MQLMLHPLRKNSFRRTVQDDGNLSVVYTFEPRTPIEVPEDHLLALKPDIGTALCVTKHGTNKPDYAATAEAPELIDAVSQPKRKRRSE